MTEFYEWMKILGALAGFAAFMWRLLDEAISYLRISVKADGPSEGWASALTSVENKSSRPKKLKYTFLLVGPEEECPLETAQYLLKCMDSTIALHCTNDLLMMRACAPVYSEGRALIPLPFYYSENVGIGDETLTYRAVIDASRLLGGKPYSVRFFLFEDGRLHRTTHDSFVNAKL